MPNESIPEYVRFETADHQKGFFGACSEFLDVAENRTIRVARATLREVETLYYWLKEHTPTPPNDAYRDDRNRFPITWFKPTAVEHIRRAERLCDLLNREGVNIKRTAQRRIGRILCEDDVQVVTRLDRAPRFDQPSFPETRFANRRNRQKRRRQRAGQVHARSRKSGLQ